MHFIKKCFIYVCPRGQNIWDGTQLHFVRWQTDVAGQVTGWSLKLQSNSEDPNIIERVFIYNLYFQICPQLLASYKSLGRYFHAVSPRFTGCLREVGTNPSGWPGADEVWSSSSRRCHRGGGHRAGEHRHDESSNRAGEGSSAGGWCDPNVFSASFLTHRLYRLWTTCLEGVLKSFVEWVHFFLHLGIQLWLVATHD